MYIQTAEQCAVLGREINPVITNVSVESSSPGIIKFPCRDQEELGKNVFSDPKPQTCLGQRHGRRSQGLRLTYPGLILM